MDSLRNRRCASDSSSDNFIAWNALLGDKSSLFLKRFFSFFFFFFFGRNFDELEDCYSSSIYLLNIIPRRRDFIRSNVLFKTVMV